jgi:hypothetical protein
VGPGDRERDALVLSDGPAEHDAFAGVGDGALHEPAPVADAFGGDQDAFGVHAVEDVQSQLAGSDRGQIALLLLL